MKFLINMALALMLISCHTATESKPDTALDAGRAFIRASLDGNFENARTLLLKDSQNVQQYNRYEKFYADLPLTERNNYKQASYEINKYEDVSDSVTIINYSNSFMHKPQEIKVVRSNDNWLVDFKYTSSGNTPIQ